MWVDSGELRQAGKKKICSIRSNSVSSLYGETNKENICLQTPSATSVCACACVCVDIFCRVCVFAYYYFCMFVRSKCLSVCVRACMRALLSWLFTCCKMCEFISNCYSLLHCLTQGVSSSSVTIVTEAGRKTSMQWQGWTGISDDIPCTLH